MIENYKVVLTGVSRGLGKELLELILKTNPSWEVIGTARTQVAEIQDTISSKFPNNKVKIEALDISSKESINEFVNRLKESNFEFDCLINNAAFGADPIENTAPTFDIANKTFASNVLGTIELTEQIQTLLKSNGRIVNVSSSMSALKVHGQEVIDIFTNPNITKEQIFEQVEKFEKGCANGDVGPYCNSAYSTSKMMLNAYSRFILKRKLKEGQLSVAMTPGHCQTDMGTSGAIRTSLEGAKSIYASIEGKRDYDHFYYLESPVDFMNCGMK